MLLVRGAIYSLPPEIEALTVEIVVAAETILSTVLFSVFFYETIILR